MLACDALSKGSAHARRLELSASAKVNLALEVLSRRPDGYHEIATVMQTVDLADAHYPVDLAYARARLGWEPRRRLRDTLPEMIARLGRDPEGWYRRNKLTLPQALVRGPPVHA